MIELLKLGVEIQTFFEEKKWGFCFIGGISLLRWGEPRFTTDIDITLFTGFEGEETYVDILLDRFEPRVGAMRDFALTNRVVLLKSSKGYPIDVALGGLPFEQMAVERSSFCEYQDGISLRTCSAEDLIVMKAFAERGKDWLDVEGIIVRQGSKLDWSYIKKQLAPLCELKESPDILPRLDALRSRIETLDT